MNDRDILRFESYKKLYQLKKQYSRLPHNDFICDGAEDIWTLQTKIIDRILNRFNKYTDRHLQHINTLIPFFEGICGYLDDSKTANVPWSIIPSLEELFSRIRPDTKFVICPLWETNYQINNRNVIDIITEKILTVRGLLFDSTKDFDDKCTNFLKGYPTAIYFVFYPRIERLSVLHFPLLGHEIGHIYSHIWSDENLSELFKNSKIEKKLVSAIEAEITPNDIDPLFLDSYIRNRLIDIMQMYYDIFSETIADIVGTFIFGPSTLFASYMFALKFGLDDFKGINDGYLSWRFRIHFIKKALNFMKADELPSRHTIANEWIDNIDKAVEIDFATFKYKMEQGKYIKFIVDLINNSLSKIYQDVEAFLDGQSYPTCYNEEHQKEVFERLENGILPNCVIDKTLNETPISLRNIVNGTWLYLCESDLSDFDKYFQDSLNMNLLSLKAIELSHFQKDFHKRSTHDN